MTYIAEKPSLSSSAKERPLITIEFTPNIHKDETEYTYEHPQFVFRDRVKLKLTYPPIPYTVRALELIESKTPSGRLLSQPRWKYKISDGEQTFWKDESALIRFEDKTCASCPHFNNFNESSGRGWCQLFDHQAREHHQQTNDCVVNSKTKKVEEELETFPTEEIIDEADLPHSEYQIGSLVKVIDSTQHHSQWTIFEVIQCVYNQNLYQSTDTYLNQPQWYYRLRFYQDGNSFPSDNSEISQSFLVAENEICDFNLSHLIRTADIF